MFKIILQHREFRMTSDAFYSSGMHRMTIKLERGYHPLKDCAQDVSRICDDLMRNNVDDCFMIGLGRMTRSEKEAFVRWWFGSDELERSALLDDLYEAAEKKALEKAA